MVRRVGFGDNKEPPKQQRSDHRSVPPPKSGGGKSTTRLIVDVFLVFWLTAWSAAIAFSINQIVDQGLGAADIGLFIWVGFASLFWLLAINMLWRVLTGRPLSGGNKKLGPRRRSVRDGDDHNDWGRGGND
jgi:hypothetical protein